MNAERKKILYIDPCSGISGDMFLGAFMDLGFSLKTLKGVIAGLKIKGCELHSKKVSKKGITATRFHVEIENIDRQHNHLKDIKKIIETSQAAGRAKKLAVKIFQKIAEAESLVHGTTPEKIHFHEVGAVDSIVDILGAAVAFDYFGFDEIVSGPVNTGSGTVKCDHGILPVPAPATAELLKGIPSYSSGIQRELTTPTGAAILATIASSFGPMPPMIIDQIGYGAGSADLKDSPNVLRIMAGESAEKTHQEEMVEVETNIDDMNPECYEYVMDALFKAGALDVFLTPVIMKKSRPAMKLSVICQEGIAEKITRTIFRETTTFGVRQWKVSRNVMARETKKVKTEYGEVDVKIGAYGDGPLQVSPEYESCAKIAKAKKVPLKVVFDAARKGYH